MAKADVLRPKQGMVRLARMKCLRFTTSLFLFVFCLSGCADTSPKPTSETDSYTANDVSSDMSADDALEDTGGPGDASDSDAADTSADTTADAGEDTAEDAGEDAAVDAGEEVPDWADPEVPPGPIPPPEGTDTTPEEEDFDWAGVGTNMIKNSLPKQNLNWAAYPQVGTAQILDWSESETCVCFDIDCTTCSEETCSAQTCTYALNDKHALTKYHVQLSANEYPAHTLTFEVNMSADPPITYTTIEDVLYRLERTPIAYWYDFKIITEFGHGIQFLHGSYFGGGAAAYGSMNYIDTQTADAPVLLHELGHTFEQYTRKGNPPTLEPQSNILNPIWRNAIRSDDNRTSPYGNNNEWEDMAEFSRIYAQCSVEGSLDELETLSPERFRIWERILLNGTTIKP
jgi:hypothetical protein